MLLTIVLVVTTASFIFTVKAANFTREVENIDDHASKLSSAVAKTIAIGIILCVCAFLTFYAYWSCIASVRSSHPTPVYSSPRSTVALPISANVRSPTLTVRGSTHVAFQYARSGASTPSTDGVSVVSVPYMPAKAYSVKTKVTAPTAGRSASSARMARGGLVV